jgi:hypothetical protein
MKGPAGAGAAPGLLVSEETATLTGCWRAWSLTSPLACWQNIAHWQAQTVEWVAYAKTEQPHLLDPV